jgi:quercetin dioxygenase-like cupin family protein
MFRSAFPDLKFTVLEMFGEGDRVITRIKIQGTHKGDFMGIDPTGKMVNVEAIDIIRFANGKAVEHWGVTDSQKMMEQLGVGQPVKIPADKDPAKVEPNHYKVIFENDRVRVLDAKYKPGEKGVMHTHPDHISYVFKGGIGKFTLPEGKSQEIEAKTGKVIWVSAGSHIFENTGKTEIHVLGVELKK